MRMHGLPLRLFHSRCHMEPYLPMELLVTPSPLPQRYACAAASSSSAAARVASSGGVLAGSSNRMFIVGGPMSGIDAVANAETGQVQIRCEVLRKAAILSVHERQVADELLNTVEEHFRLKQRMREMREEAAVSSHLAAAAEAASVVAQGGGGFSAVVRVQSLDAPIPTESNLNEDEGVASRVRSQLALYTFRLLQAAARQACTTNWSPDSLKRELAEHEMPRIHGAAWTAAWQATSNFDRWLAEHNPMIASRSKAPSSPVLMAAVKDTMKSGLLDFRQSLRESMGAKSGIRKAMKSRFSSFFSEFSTPNASFSSATPHLSTSSSPRTPHKTSPTRERKERENIKVIKSAEFPRGMISSTSQPNLKTEVYLGLGRNFSADDALLVAQLRAGRESAGEKAKDEGSFTCGGNDRSCVCVTCVEHRSAVVELGWNEADRACEHHDRRKHSASLSPRRIHGSTPRV